jgi:hypothetical protein
MTVIVGILCSDGVVIGSDSALAVGRVGRYTIERQEGDVFKIETSTKRIETGTKRLAPSNRTIGPITPSLQVHP